MPSITVTVDVVQYLAGCSFIAGLIIAAYWCGRADRRDGRVFVGIRENDARFEQMRAVRVRARRRVEAALATLQAVSQPVEESVKPRWAPVGSADVVDEDVPPVRDEDREVEADEDGYPHGMRAEFGAMRLPHELHGDANSAVWPVNGPAPAASSPRPGRHHIEGDHRTRDLRAAIGTASPPGVSA